MHLHSLCLNHKDMQASQYAVTSASHTPLRLLYMTHAIEECIVEFVIHIGLRVCMIQENGY